MELSENNWENYSFGNPEFIKHFGNLEKGIYEHKKTKRKINVIHTTDKYVVIRFYNYDVARSIDYIDDFVFSKVNLKDRKIH